MKGVNMCCAVKTCTVQLSYRLRQAHRWACSMPYDHCNGMDWRMSASVSFCHFILLPRRALQTHPPVEMHAAAVHGRPQKFTGTSLTPAHSSGDFVLTCRSVPQLQDLDLFFNPVRQHKAYSVVLSALTRLSQLDRAPVLAQQQGLQAGTTGVTAALLRERATLWHSNSGELPGQSSCTVPSAESWIEVVLTPSAGQCT